MYTQLAADTSAGLGDYRGGGCSFSIGLISSRNWRIASGCAKSMSVRCGPTCRIMYAARLFYMGYNVGMVKGWKITRSDDAAVVSAQPQQGSVVWDDNEDAELEKLSRKATETARKSLAQICRGKAQERRKQMLEELRAAR